jgi:hypothetical protein
VPSASHAKQLAVLALCGALGAGSLSGCETTQEKAAAQRAKSERILEARAKRQKRHGTKSQNAHADGTKSQAKSSRRRDGLGRSARGGQEGEG